MKKETVLYIIIAILIAIVAFLAGTQTKNFTLRKNKSNDIKDIYGVRRSVDPQQRVSGQAVMPFATDPLMTHNWDTWDPFYEMEEMHKMMNRMMNQMHNSPALSGLRTQVMSFDPELDAQETKDAYIYKLDLPGIDKDKISVKIENNYLTVSGQREVEQEQTNEDQGFYRRERSFGSFSRSFPLPNDANTEAMKAEAKNGVLTITLPKLTEEKESVSKKVAVT